jgi:hypothetical protein
MFWLNNFLFIGVNMKTITWVRKAHNFTNLTFLYANILTGEKIQEYTNGQCSVFNSTKPASKPLEFFIAKDFDNWEFWAGCNYDEIPEIGTYCCDGEGIVQVRLYPNGIIQLFDQGIPEMILSPDIDEAMEKAADYLKVLYPQIYKQFLG